MQIVQNDAHDILGDRELAKEKSSIFFSELFMNIMELFIATIESETSLSLWLKLIHLLSTALLIYKSRTFNESHS